MGNWARSLDREGTPGPGSYNLRTKIGASGPKFSIKGKYSSERTEPQPAPAYRAIPSSIGQGPKYSLGVKSTPAEREGTPGPSYCPPPFGSSKTRQSFGTLPLKNPTLSPRRPVNASYNYSQSGPGQFMISAPQSALPQTISPRYAATWLKPNDAPPSTHYNPLSESMFASSPRFSIRAIPKPAKPDKTPGPADYSPIDNHTQRQTTVGSLLKAPKQFKTPGPGEYAVASSIGKEARKCGIGGSIHSKQDDSANAPYYSVPRLFDSPTARKTLHQKVHCPSDFSTPGPGSYKRPDDWVKRGATMASRESKVRNTRDSWIPENCSPGPAEYIVREPGQDSAPHYSFGSGLGASWVNKTSNPGPGDYTPRAAQRTAGWTIRPRCEMKETECATEDARFVILPEDHGRSSTIHNKDYLPLVVN